MMELLAADRTQYSLADKGVTVLKDWLTPSSDLDIIEQMCQTEINVLVRRVWKSYGSSATENRILHQWRW